MREKGGVEFLPKTSAGNWSIAFSVVFVVLAILCRYISIPLVIVYFAEPISIACLIFGMAAIIKKDKAILIFLPIIIGLYGVVWAFFQIIY